MAGFNPADHKETAGFTPKTFGPGLLYARIHNIALERPAYVKDDSKDDLAVIVTLEGPDEGPEFQGFAIYKNDPSLGNYQGKVGRVANGTFPFSTYTYDNKLIERDGQIFNFLGDLLKQMGKKEEAEEVFARNVAADPNYALDTIEEYAEFVAPILADGVTYGLFTVQGKPYTNANNHTNYNLFFAKKVTGKNPKYPFAAVQSEDDRPDTLLVLSEKNVQGINEYIVEPVKKAAPAAEGAAPAGEAGPGVAAFGGVAGQTTPAATPAPAPGAGSDELDQLPF